MAVGCAVVLCDFAGLGALVTNENFVEMRKLNFGTGNLLRKLDPGLIAAEVQRYDASEAQSVAARVRREANLRSATCEWVEMYREILEEGMGEPDAVEELAAMAQYLVKWGYDARIAQEREHIERLAGWPVFGRWFQWFIERERTRIFKSRDSPGKLQTPGCLPGRDIRT